MYWHVSSRITCIKVQVFATRILLHAKQGSLLVNKRLKYGGGTSGVLQEFFNYSPYNYSARQAREKKNRPRLAKFNSADWHARRPARPANWIFSLVVPLISVVPSATRVTNARANKRKAKRMKRGKRVRATETGAGGGATKNRLESFDDHGGRTSQPATKRESDSSRAE